MITRHSITIIVLLLLSVLPAQAQPEPLQVLASTTIIADVARNVGGDLVNVSSLLPPLASAHGYQPTPQDAALIEQAQVFLVNGAGLETFLGGLEETLPSVEPIVVSAGVEVLALDAMAHDDDHYDDHDDMDDYDDHDDMDDHDHDAHELGHLGVDVMCDDDHDETIVSDAHDHGICDPHFWTDPENVMVWADNIAAALGAADPDNADIYTANAARYKRQLDRLDDEIEAMAASIPQAQRVLVTNHEFLGYFADEYDFEIIGVIIPGGTDMAEPSPQAIAALIEVVQAADVPAIFTESSISDQLTSTVAEETGASVALLYSGSLSEADGPAATYIDYMRYNTETIVAALAP